MKTIVGYNEKRAPLAVGTGDEQQFVNELNSFYARFDTYDFSKEISDLTQTLSLSDDTGPSMNEEVVAKLFTGLKPNKASGPDNIKPRVLKACAWELASIFLHMFKCSINESFIPVGWKCSKIIPVPKSKCVKGNNDLRPVALTSIVMKCLERFVLNSLLPVCGPFLDPQQYAYKSGRGADDAILFFFTDNVYKHVDTPGNYVRTLFVDFSSAFNTIQPHLLIPKMLGMGVSEKLALWVLQFLTQRSQFVAIKTEKGQTYESSIIITNTGAPQGSVIAPVLFTLYTNDCQSTCHNVPLIKYADDTSIQALITSDTDLTNYMIEIGRFVTWCKDHYLQLNIKKTKEFIIDFRRKDNAHDSIVISGETVERVNEYKYLGVVFDDQLNWYSQSKSVLTKMNQRMYFMRKLNSFHVDPTLISLFYQSCVLSIITFCLSAWGGNMRESEKRKLNSHIKRAHKILKNTPIFLDHFIDYLSHKKILKIEKDPTHPLYKQLKYSERSGRLIHLKCNRERYLNSFMPLAIRTYSKFAS